MSSASISDNHAPAIGECVNDTQSLDCLYPVTAQKNSKGEQGFAVLTWNFHSRCFQPVGAWHANKMDAIRERDSLLETLDQEVAS